MKNLIKKNRTQLFIAILLILPFIIYKYYIVTPILKFENSPYLDWHEGVVIDEIGNPVTMENITLRSVIYEQGKYVAVGDKGIILTSINGFDWTKQFIEERNGSNYLHGIGYGDGKFIVVGKKGNIFISTDAFHWQHVESGTDLNLSSVTYGQGKFIITSQHSILLYSNDGYAWTEHNPFRYYIPHIDLC